MKDTSFEELLEENTPPCNPMVMEGLAVHALKDLDSYVDQVFTSIARSFPPGLTYDGYDHCSDKDEYAEITRLRSNRQAYDLAPTDVYMNRYKFSFNGQKLPDRFMWLPFVGDAGMLRLSGTLYHITPVLSDKVITPGNNTMFVRLLRDKITFRRLYHWCRLNDRPITSHVVFSPIYRHKGDKNVAATTKAESSLVHYLLGKYGFTEMFKRFTGFVPIVGDEDMTEVHYPRDQYVICSSAQTKPKSFIGEFYRPSTIRLAIPIEHWTPFMESMVVGFYYAVDHFPERFQKNDLDRTFLWQILLGHIVYSGLYGEGKLYERISQHYVSLDDYLDPIAQEKLADSGFKIDDFYSLLALVIEKFKDMVRSNENAAMNMYGKNLECLYYVAYPITSALINTNYLLQRTAARRQLTFQDVVGAFNKRFKPGAIFELTAGKIIAEVVSYSGDHKYPKLTAHITAQESKPGGARGSRQRLVVSENQHLDMSMIEGGSILNLSKSNPTPTQRINPFVQLSANMTIVQNPKFAALFEKTAALYLRANRHG